MTHSLLTACGGYLPEKILTNRDLEAMVDTSDEWVSSRTGIRQRHIAAEGERTSDMAAHAARAALAAAKVDAADVGLIVVATTTPDYTFPSTAACVQAKIGNHGAAAFDVQAVCAGFIYALSTADNFIRSGQVKTALVIGADKMSSIVDWTDRNTCVLFGDGAGAVVLQATEDKSRGILSSHLYSDGQYSDILRTSGGPSSTGQVGKVTMQGQEVFKHAVDKMASCVRESLEKNNVSVGDIRHFIPHQANSRILDMVAKKLGLEARQVVSHVASHANTSAASIPLALHEQYRAGALKEGDLVAMTAIGGGLAWGSCLLRW